MDNVMFVTTVMSATVLTSLLCGAVIKMWRHGIRGVKLLFYAPFVLIIAIILPILISKQIIFNRAIPELADKIEGYPVKVKLKVLVGVNLEMLRNYPEFVSMVAWYASKIKVTIKVTETSAEEYSEVEAECVEAHHVQVVYKPIDRIAAAEIARVADFAKTVMFAK